MIRCKAYIVLKCDADPNYIGRIGLELKKGSFNKYDHRLYFGFVTLDHQLLSVPKGTRCTMIRYFYKDEVKLITGKQLQEENR